MKKQKLKTIVKDKISDLSNKVKVKVNPFSSYGVKDQLLLSLSLIKTSLIYLIKGLSNIDKLLLKSPFIGTLYYLFKKIIIPLLILRSVLKKFRLLRYFIYLASMILANNFDLITINLDNIITTL